MLYFWMALSIACLLALITQTYFFIRAKSESAIMKHIIEFDSLTGLYTERGFDKKASAVIKRNQYTEFYLINIDIDNFGLYQSIYGIDAGNSILQFIGIGIKKVLQKDEIACRLSGDQFFLLIKSDSGDIVERVTRCYELFRPSISDKHITLHFGICKVTDIFTPIQELRYRAWAANRSIKGDQLKTVAIYNSELALKQKKQSEFSTLFAHAIKTNMIKVHLQPKFNATTEQLVGAEALSRWVKDETGAFYSPNDFVPILERTSLICHLDFYVYRHVCHTISLLLREGIPVVPISVNFSRQNLNNKNFCTQLTDIADKYMVPHSLLEIELTESIFFEDVESLLAVVSKIKAAGFKVAIDDFGKGYSSLNLVSRNTFDVIKIDQSFICEKQSETNHDAVLKTILELTKELNLETVAEGVESKDQLDLLKSAGCDVIQGFYFAKPMPIYEFERLLKKN